MKILAFDCRCICVSECIWKRAGETYCRYAGRGRWNLTVKPLLESEGDGKREGEKRGLWLRRVPITAVTDLYLKQIIKKPVNYLKWSSGEKIRRKWRREVDRGIDIKANTGKRHLWKEWVTTWSHAIQMGEKQVGVCVDPSARNG